MSTCKETACTSCSHLDVCKLKSDFLKAQTAVDNLMVHLDGGRSIYLHDISWIPAVSLRCQHHRKDFQGGAIR